ncbi:MAG: hypothetical protein HY248_06890, partial [Fimbriimonas ginsengisoli]|nr:hypothetical protein [Fimbriimonas ginsengisoli]
RGFTGGEFSSEIDATTDESGVARIEFETKGKNDPNDMPTDFDYSVSVSIQEAGGQAFDGQGSVRVTRGDFSIHVEPDDYIVRPGSAVKCAVRVLGVDTPVKPGANRKVRLEIGTMHYDREKVEFERTSSLDGVTGVDGIATFTVPAGRHGLVALRAVIDDERGHRITDQSEFYVEGGTWPTWMDQGKLGVRFDKRQYDVGDIARVLIRTSKPGGVALLCVEGERLLESRIVKLGSETTTVELPVLKHDAPNATVSVVYIRAKQFSEQRAAMTVRQTAKQLTVEITPGKVSYHPGDTASVTVRTTNHAGKPVSAEVSVEVVDEAIYALAPESTNPERGLYPLRPDLVRTEYSFPEIYLDGGDKGTKSTAIRKRFQDTAYWAPFVQTGADGMARVSVPLPDNLTSWRTTAVAVSDDSAVGMSSANFRARKELMVRIETPSFLVAGDRQSIAVSVTNDDARDATIRLRMEAIGLTLPKSSDDLRVAAGKTESLHLDVAASRAGEASLTVTARSDAGASDGVRRTVTIQPHGRLVETMVGGMTQGSANLSFTLRQNADPNAGRLRVSFSPSIGVSLLRSLDRLVGFPYGCVEQTMSRFLPSVVVGKAFRDLGIHRPDLEARVPRIADDGFARLQKMQHSDGGWGWWTYDKS